MTVGLVVVCRKEDLHLMYKLFIRVAGAVDELKKAFNSYLRRKGQELVEDTNRDKELIEDLLAFKGKADALLEASFERADPFSYSVKDAFEYILNVKQVSAKRAAYQAGVVYCQVAYEPVVSQRARAARPSCWPSTWTESSRARRASGKRTWSWCWTASWCCSATSGPRTCSRPSTRRTCPRGCC